MKKRIWIDYSANEKIEISLASHTMTSIYKSDFKK